MMASLLLQAWTRLLMPMMLLFSVFLLLAGHNDPGGGFVGGLVAAAAFALHALAFGLTSSQQALRVHPRNFIGAGLLMAMGSGLFALLGERPYLTGEWGYIYIPMLGRVKAGTPLIFDIGVYFVVVGVTLMIVYALMEESDGA